jgi:transcriptional regulator GlxA family with amidase domain
MTTATDRPLKVAILVCPHFAIMDVIGVHTVFGIVPNAEVHLVWKTMEPISAVPPFPTHATTTFANAPSDFDVVMVGAVPPDVIADSEVQAFFRHHHERGAYLIGVCGGALLLGAAGLLEGKRATTNFHCLDALKGVGATPVSGGQVILEERIYTAGPVTGAFEAALLVLAKLRGEETARFVELTIEYAPNPPFGVGSPDRAGTELTNRSLAAFAPMTQAVGEAAAGGFQRNAARPIEPAI